MFRFFRYLVVFSVASYLLFYSMAYADTDYTGNYSVSGKVGMAAPTSPGALQGRPCYKENIHYRMDFKVKQVDGQYILDETQLKDEMIAFSTTDDGFVVEQVLLKRKSYEVRRVLIFTIEGHKVFATGQTQVIDAYGDIHCNNSLTLHGKKRA